MPEPAMEPELDDYVPEPAMELPELDDDVALSGARQAATKARFRLGYYHPEVLRVDAETFWEIFRAGANWELTESAQMSPMLHKAAEAIVLMATARADGSELFDVARELIANAEPMPLLEEYRAVRESDLRRLEVAVGLP